MSTALMILALVVAAALAFDYINGFHDAANAVATVVSTGVLPLRTAVLMAALLNFAGALTGTAVAEMIGTGLIEAGAVTQVVVLVGLAGRDRLEPGHLVFRYSLLFLARAGGRPGRLRAWPTPERGRSDIAGLVKVVESLIISPIIGFAIAFVLMIGLMWACRNGTPPG